MSLSTKLLRAKTNIVGTILIASGSSFLTAYVMSGNSAIDSRSQAVGALPTTSTAAAIECGEEIYSPIQRTCVTKEVFDSEMKRLFAALGLDASVYTSGSDTN